MNMYMSMINYFVKDIDEDFHQVNWGGCGCVANILAHALREEFPIMRIVVSGNSSADLDKIREYLNDPLDKREWNRNNIYFDHVWVEVLYDGQWWCIDSTGVREPEDMYDLWGRPAEGSFTFEEIKALAEMDDWNPTFDREQIPEIEHYVQSNVVPHL